MLSVSSAYRYFLYTKAADMRRNFDGLCGLVANEFAASPHTGDVYVFINKRCTQIKLLRWLGDGFAIYYKRLEKGTFERPVHLVQHDELSMIKLKARELLLIMEGIQLLRVKQRVRYTQNPVEL